MAAQAQEDLKNVPPLAEMAAAVPDERFDDDDDDTLDTEFKAEAISGETKVRSGSCVCYFVQFVDSIGQTAMLTVSCASICCDWVLCGLGTKVLRCPKRYVFWWHIKQVCLHWLNLFCKYIDCLWPAVVNGSEVGGFLTSGLSFSFGSNCVRIVSTHDTLS